MSKYLNKSPLDEISTNVWEILVPTQLNDGTPIRTRYHRVWDKKVRNIANGLTILQPVIGQWVSSDEQLYKERMIPVRIACTKKQIDEIADITANYYNQKAIMYYLVSDEIYIKNY